MLKNLMLRTISEKDWEEWKNKEHSPLDYFNFIKKFSIPLPTKKYPFRMIHSCEVEKYISEYFNKNGWQKLVSMIVNSNLDAWLDDEVFCLFNDGSIDVVNDEITLELIETSLKENNQIGDIKYTKEDWEEWKKEYKGNYSALKDLASRFDIIALNNILFTNHEVSNFIQNRMTFGDWNWQDVQESLEGIDLHKDDRYFHLDSDYGIYSFQTVKDWDYYAKIIEKEFSERYNWN